MGRKRKYFTKEQIEKSKKDRQKRYYNRHREEITEKNLNRYHNTETLPPTINI